MSIQSVQFEVLDQVVEMLGGNAAGAWRCRFRNFAYKDLPAINVIPESSEPDYKVTDQVDRTFRFHLRHLASVVDSAGEPVDGADRAADTLYVESQRLLMADRSLGGFARAGTLREVGQKWEAEEATRQTIALVVTYECQFSTAINDPSLPGY